LRLPDISKSYSKKGQNVLHIIRALRIKSWIKNSFVFIPIVFALSLSDYVKLTATCLTALAFCFLSSAVYIFNDIRDIEQDRKHPKKRERPIAGGALSVNRAAVIGAVLAGCSLLGAFYIDIAAGIALVVYVIVNISYSLYLKNKPIFDVFCIAAGFILRVYAGSFASDSQVSDWLFLSIVALCLFIAFGKRRGELCMNDEDCRRPVLESYNLSFLNNIMFCMAGMAVTFYSLWAKARNDGMIYSVPIIIFIVTKYLLLIQNKDSDGDPTEIVWSNRTLMFSCIFYILVAAFILYKPFFV
jgi:4-hydroxybenzoate polyprenyltransferase